MQQLLTGKKRLPGFEKLGTNQGEKQDCDHLADNNSTNEATQINASQIKDSGQTAPRPSYKQTELGETNSSGMNLDASIGGPQGGGMDSRRIPEDWEVKPLGELGKFKNGVNKDGDSFGYGEPFINLMDVFGKTSIKGDEKLGLINSTELDRKEYDLRLGDVLFIRSSVKPSGVGLTAVVLSNLEKTIYSGFLIRYRSFSELDTQFKEFCFHEADFRKRIVAASSVSANTNINQDSLKQILLAYPSDLKEQTAIANVLSDMDTELDALQQRLSKTQKIKQGMMQELLTGKTRLLNVS